jgi:tyrosyl-tRNA synthetase
VGTLKNIATITEEKPIWLHEFLYPLMQGYDSVAMDVDLEIGGNDQTFNMLVGRDLVKALKQKEKFVLTTRLLEHPQTGEKFMNKSVGGLVNLDDAPEDMFGKIMALDDGAIVPLAEFCTDLPMDEVKKIKTASVSDPRGAKLTVAVSVVATVYGKAAAARAEREFSRVFQEKQEPTDIKTIQINVRTMPLAKLLIAAGLASSRSEARRLIEQGGVRVAGEKKTDAGEVISLPDRGVTIRVGPRRFARVVPW